MSATTLLKVGARLLEGADHIEHDDHDDHADHEDHEGHDDHDDHKDEGDEGISVDAFKWIMLLCMLLCVGFGIVPKIWDSCGRNEEALSYLNCFSAGLFMAMAIVHMMPESAEMYNSWAKKEGIERPFPLPYICFFLGYFLILAIDRVAARKNHLKFHLPKD